MHTHAREVSVATPTPGASRTPVRAGVVGAAGYVGAELVGLLARHPAVDLCFATSRSRPGEPSPVSGLRYSRPDEGEADEADVVFLCVPHGEAGAWVDRLAGGPRIIDLTGDHRPGSGAEGDAVYGLAEWNRAAISSAGLVANPGCYPTGVLLALLPLVRRGFVDASRLVMVSAASGVTGAGRTPRTDLLFAEVSGNFRAYGTGNRHRHLKEMDAWLDGLPLLFQPHLLPVPRGILETIVLPVAEGVDARTIHAAWTDAYTDEPAVRVLSDGLPGLAGVVGTDRLDLGAVDTRVAGPPVLTLGAALDNLGKGAAGQAVQNLNAMLGLPTGVGIRC